jgi:prepilin-type N-terminal cleavage/methylation domain-containing protein
MMMKSAQQHNMNDSGYTLLEVLTVLALTAIIASTALPWLQPSDQRQVRMQAEEIMSQLRRARLDALKFGEPKKWTADGAAMDIAMKVDLPKESADDRQEITFYPDATATGATVTLQKGTASVAIFVSADGGWIGLSP